METFQERRDVEGQCDGGRFDASQYAFFGKAGVTQDVELGGLDDDDEANDVEDDDGFLSTREELGGLDASSELGDLGEVTSSFTKVNVNDTEGDKFRGHLDSHIGKDVHDLPVDINWTENNEYERKQWAQSPETSRGASQWWTSANQSPAPPFSIPKPHAHAPVSSVGSSYRQQFPVSSGPQAGHGMMHYGNVGLPQQPTPWSPIPGASRPPPQHMPSQLMLQFQRPQGFHGVPHFSPMPQQMNVLPPGMQKLEVGIGDYRGKQTPRGSPDSSYGGRKSNEGLPQMRSKYMTTDEIETIIRIQWAATHGSDPYIDDYYHQAMQAKLAGGTPHGRRHFAPSHLRELPPHARTAAEPHAFLQVDALGRIPFSSIRRPRPLLDVDGVNGTGAKVQTDSASSQRRLEQEPMLAARIAVEDGLCLLLDVDDIDRMLASTPQPDCGLQLRRRRQMLLEGLAASLQLVDPLAPSTPNSVVNPKDDLVFLRLVSLPKGRKLLSKYLHLLPPDSELARVVLMAVFRHLRFLFGGLQSDPSAAASSAGLTNAVAASIKSMDLPSLSACLAAVLLASEPPPLRPIGSSSGDGATVALQAVLDRATAVLSDRGVHYPVQSTTIWQASFDAFFGLLSNYCTNKYESIMHSLMMASTGNNNSSVIASAAAAAMAREIPIELLRASLPHTDEQQRRRLLEFAQRSIVSPSGTGIHSATMDVNTAAVRG